MRNWLKRCDRSGEGGGTYETRAAPGEQTGRQVVSVSVEVGGRLLVGRIRHDHMCVCRVG